MKWYQIDGRRKFHKTLAAAHEAGKEVSAVFRPDVRIQEVEIANDQEGMDSLLNRGEPIIVRRGRVWTLTTRGGLRQLTDETGKTISEQESDTDDAGPDEESSPARSSCSGCGDCRCHTREVAG